MLRMTHLVFVTLMAIACSEQKFSNGGKTTSDNSKTTENNVETGDNSNGSDETKEDANTVYKYICKKTQNLALSSTRTVEIANLPADARRIEFEFQSFDATVTPTADLTLFFNQTQTGIVFIKDVKSGGNKGDVVQPLAKVGSNTIILQEGSGATASEKVVNVSVIAAYETNSPCPSGFITEEKL